jgi:hypothetical protein
MPTQPKLCIPIIKRMCQKMAHDIKFEEIKICDNLIVDGHHRYLSSLIMGAEIGTEASHKTSATKPVNWLDVEFEENDWDTELDILHFNEQDAIYNGLNIEFLKRITSNSV